MATELVAHRVGGWLPQDHSVLRRWLDKKVQHLDGQRSRPEFVPVIKEFQDLIESDESLLVLFQQMFTQVPNKPPYDKDPTQKPQVRDYMTMLGLFNMILTEAPEFTQYDLVGFPINAILDWPMGTPSGFTAFYLPSVNAQFRKMLNEWALFLGSPASCYVLTSDPGGWFSKPALEALGSLEEDFITDPTQLHYGFLLGRFLHETL